MRGSHCAVGHPSASDPQCSGINLESNLVRRSDPDHVISGTKTIEDEVVVGNDIRGCQHLVVSGKVGITSERNVETLTHGTSASSVHTVLGHASRNDEVGNPSFLKFSLKRRSEERVRFSLSDDVLAIGWLERRVNFPAFCMGLQRMPLWAVMLNVDHRNCRNTCFRYEGSDSGQNAPLDLSGH